MARDYKRSYKAYFAWDYQKEIDDLNKESEKGWQLIEGGCFSSKFKRNQELRYRYQIDYPGKVEDFGRYIETFREQGWEFINKTFNGWYYFRKVYDPSLPEEEYEIFTDRSSLQEMNDRWTKLAVSLSVLIGIFTAVQLVLYVLTPTLPGLIRVITFGIVLAVFGIGMIAMKNPERRKSNRWSSAMMAVFLLAVIAGNTVSILLTESRPFYDITYGSEQTDAIPAELDKALQWDEITIEYKDSYYMDLEIQADAPVCFAIMNESGEIIYTVSGASVAEEDIKLSLEKGVYTTLLSDFSGGALNVSLDIN